MQSVPPNKCLLLVGPSNQAFIRPLSITVEWTKCAGNLCIFQVLPPNKEGHAHGKCFDITVLHVDVHGRTLNSMPFPFAYSGKM